MSGRAKAAAILLIFMVVCTVLSAAGLSLYANSRQGRELLLRKINATIPGIVTAAHHRLSLFSGEILFQDLTIRDPQGIGVAGVDSLSVNLSLASLLRKVLIVEDVNLKRPWAHLSIDGSGRLNLLKVFTATSAAENASKGQGASIPFNVIFRQFNLSGGQLLFSGAMSGVDLKLHDVNLAAKGNLRDQSGVLKLKVGASQVAYDGYQSDIKHFDLALALKNGHIEPLVIKTENQFAALLLYGDVYQAFSDPELDLALDMDVDLNASEAFFGVDQGDTGRVKVLVNIKGKPGNPRMSLRADYGGGTLMDRPVGHVGLEARLIDRTATLENLSVDTGFGRLNLSGQVDLQRVFPDGFLLPPGDWEETGYRVRLRTAALDLASLPGGGEKISGKMDALLKVIGKGVSPDTLAAEADATIVLKDFRSKGMVTSADMQSRIIGRVQDGTIWLDALEGTAADLHISAGGHMDVDAAYVDARFKLESSEIASFLAVFGLSRLKGAVAVNGHVEGRPTDPAISILSSGRNLHIRDIDMGNVVLEAQLDETGRLVLETLRIDNKGSFLQAEGDIQLFAAPFKLDPEMPLRARFAFSNVEYEDFFSSAFPGIDIRGSLGGEVILGGTGRALEARADLFAKGIGVEQLRLGDVSGQARFFDGNLLLDTLRLTNRRTDVNASGEIRLLRKGAWQPVDDSVFKLALADGHIFLEDFSKELSGELRIDADLAGRLKAPRGRLTLKGNDLNVGVQKIEALALAMQAGDHQVSIEYLDIVMPGGGNVKGEGRVGHDQSYQFSLQTHDLPIESIDWVREIKTIGGQLNIDIQGAGVLYRPEINGKAEWKNIRVRGETIEDLRLRFGLKDNRIFLEGQQTFDLSAGYDLTSRAFLVDLVMDKTRLAPWFSIAGRPELGGRISGSVRAEGTADDLRKTRAAIDVQNLDLVFKGDRFTATKHLKGTFNNGYFSIPKFYMDLMDQGSLAIEASGDISGEVDLTAEGEIPLKTAHMLVPDLPVLEGNLLLRTSVKGTFSEPQLEGVIRLEQGGMKIPELQQELHRVNGEIRFVANEDVVGSFSGMLETGRFDVQVTIDLAGFLPKHIEARINAVALPLQIPGTLALLFNTDLSVRGTLEDMVVAGDVILLEGTYYKDFKLNLLQAIQEEKREESPPQTELTYAYLKPLRFDIHLKHRQPFLVDNNIAYMEISPDVMLGGTPETPIITGSAKVDNGAITYQNKEFVIQRGAVDFTNPYQTEAEIDIKGEVQIREWRITISLSGPPDRLKIELSSSPPEEDADILSLLIFNKTTYELNTGSSGISQSPTVLLAKLLASSFGADIKKSTGLDVLEVEGESAADQDATDRIKVTVGKDLTERITLKYSVESKDGGYVQQASTEYKLFEYFLVSGFQDTKGVYGGELIFRLSFRLFR